MTASEREEISISCLGRNPAIIKRLLHEARDAFLKKDEAKTAIYRGTTKAGSSEPQWQRCMSRVSRPFSTVILNDKVKQDLIDDVTDYLNPTTRRWYANRGIPYRRGYLLYGPPGTGKSSLSLALAGFVCQIRVPSSPLQVRVAPRGSRDLQRLCSLPHADALIREK
jgi:chaperone BCS1